MRFYGAERNRAESKRLSCTHNLRYRRPDRQPMSGVADVIAEFRDERRDWIWLGDDGHGRGR